MPGAVAPDEQLEWERRAAKPAGIAAIASALLLLGGGLIYRLASGRNPIGLVNALLEYDKHPADVYVPGILQALSYLALVLPLTYLYRATKARRPELFTAAKYLAIGGPIVAAVAFLGLQILFLQAARDFAAERIPTTVPAGTDAAGLFGVLTVAQHRAKDILASQPGTAVFAALQYAGLLAVAFAFVLISLNAMRAGLLSRFTGIIGVLVGALTVFNVIPQLGDIGVVLKIFWLGAIGLLLLDRWPNGRGPAWEVVEAIPWPSAAAQRAAQLEHRAQRDEPDDDYEDEDAGDGRNGSAPAPHPASKKRKKKRRR
jgi:hypothetical protein